MDDYLLLDSSLDEDESMEKKEFLEKGLVGKKIYDVIFVDFLVEFIVGKYRVVIFIN